MLAAYSWQDFANLVVLVFELLTVSAEGFSEQSRKFEESGICHTEQPQECVQAFQKLWNFIVCHLKFNRYS